MSDVIALHHVVDESLTHTGGIGGVRPSENMGGRGKVRTMREGGNALTYPRRNLKLVSAQPSQEPRLQVTAFYVGSVSRGIDILPSPW